MEPPDLAARANALAPTPREAVLAYYDAVDARDNERLLAMFHPSVEYRRGGYPPIRGIAELRYFYEKVRVIADGRHIAYSAIAEGDMVAVRGGFTGTSRDGHALAIDWADFFIFADGLILERFTYFMTPGV